MTISESGLALIKRFEGLRLRAYDDGVGVQTIGYGHTRGVKAGDTCTKEQADAWLREDVADATAAVGRLVTVGLTQPQRDALISFVFNVGATAFSTSTLLRLLNAGDYQGAADQLPRWNKGGGKVMAGLTKRRAAERDLFLSTQVSTQGSPLPVSPDNAPEGEPMAPAIPLLLGLASSLVQAFTPLAREKITKEMNRHTDDPQIAGQIATGIIETAKAVTGMSDPIEATVAAKADPEMMQAVESGALETLERMGPLLDRINAWDKEAWDASEASSNAAAERARGEAYDMAKPLLYSAMTVVGVLLVGLMVVAGIQIFKAGNAATEVWAAITGLIGWATAKAGSIYDYRFGTSRSSSAKDVVIGELAKRPK